MGINYAPFVADLFLFCYERDFMMSLLKQADIIDVFNTTSTYLDDILNINNIYFDTTVSQIHPSELFQTCICQFLIILFLPKFMINMTILNLQNSNF